MKTKSIKTKKMKNFKEKAEGIKNQAVEAVGTVKDNFKEKPLKSTVNLAAGIAGVYFGLQAIKSLFTKSKD